jgi:hypothetical protein
MDAMYDWKSEAYVLKPMKTQKFCKEWRTVLMLVRWYALKGFACM